MTGDELRSLRGVLGLTQVELAAELDITRFSIIEYERGYTPVPGPVAVAVRLMAEKRRRKK